MEDQQRTAKVKNARRGEERRRWQRLWRRTQWIGHRGRGGSERPLALGNTRS